jgi:hypothetical protein
MNLTTKDLAPLACAPAEHGPENRHRVIAAGVAVAAVGVYLTNRGTTGNGLHYASALAIEPSKGPPGRLRLIIWLVLDFIWAVASVVVLRSSPESDVQFVKGP